MAEFKMRPDAFKEIRRQTLLVSIPMMLLMMTAGVFIATWNRTPDESDVNILPFVIPFFVLMGGISLYRGMKRRKALFESFTLTISDKLIVRAQLNTPDLAIFFNEVSEISRTARGGFIIRGKSVLESIHVPAQIDRYNELENTLQAIKPIAVHLKKRPIQKLSWLFAILTPALMVAVYIGTNKILVGISGALVTCLSIWAFYVMLRSKNIDHRSKRMLIFLPLIILSVIIVTILKLTNNY